MSAVERTTELKSLDEVKAVYGEKWPGFFNNFSLKYPALYKTSIGDEREILEVTGAMELPFSAFHGPNKLRESFLQRLTKLPKIRVLHRKRLDV